MRPCTNCRSEATAPLDQSVITRLVSAIGGDPLLRAWVCSVCRHVDVWVDEAIPSVEAAVAEAEVPMNGEPELVPIPAT